MQPLFFGICLFGVLLVCLGQTTLYVDSEKGSDSWSAGSKEAPYKTLDYALRNVKGNATIVYLKEGQIFSDLKSQVVQVDNNLIIKCWTIDEKPPSLSSYASILFSRPDISFSVTESLQFDGIRFQKSGNIYSSTLISIATGARLILQSVEFSNYLFDGSNPLLASGSAYSSISITNTIFRGLELNSASFVRLLNGGNFTMNGVMMTNCTFHGSPAFALNGSFSFSLYNSTFEKNTIYDNPLFLFHTETRYPLQIDSVVFKVNDHSSFIDNSLFFSFTLEQQRFITALSLIYGQSSVLQKSSIRVLLTIICTANNFAEISIFLANSRFEDNFISENTSVIEAAGNQFIVTNCTFENNSKSYSEISSNQRGTGVLTIYSTNASIKTSNFSSNRNDRGGAIFFQSSSKPSRLSISQTGFKKNKALFGGSIYVQSESHGLDIKIDGSYFSANNADNFGGAIYFSLSGSNDQVSCLLSRNIFVVNQAGGGQSDGSGGAIYFGSAGRLSLINNTFEINTAITGGGALYYEGGSVLYSAGNIFSENVAHDETGGAVSVSNADYTDENNTYLDNYAARGGAIYVVNNRNFTLNNTRFETNTATFRGGCLEGWVVIRLIIINSNFSNCKVHQAAGALYVTRINGGEINDTYFSHGSSNTGGLIEISEANDYVGALKISRCHFFGNAVELHLIKIYYADVTLNDCTFTNNKGALINIEQNWYTEARLARLYAVNTSCSKRIPGCFLDARGSAKVTLEEITVVNMTMSSVNSAVVLNSLKDLKLVNSAFSNISGSERGACLYASDNFNNNLIANFSVYNFTSGCMLIENSEKIFINNFSAYNYGEKKINSEDTTQVISVLQLKDAKNIRLSDIQIRGNKYLSRSKGGALHFSNCRNITIANATLEDNLAEFGGALFIQNTTGLIKRATFVNNSAAQGGGLYAENSSSSGQGTLTLSELNFTGNRAYLTGGGAHFEEMNNLTLKNTIFHRNTCLRRKSLSIANNSRGGAIYYSCEQLLYQAVVEGLIVTNNSADIGGAIYFNNSIFDPTNGSNFTNNSATGLNGYGPTFASSPIQILHGEELENDANTTVTIFLENGTSMSRAQFVRAFFIDPINLTETRNWKRFVDPRTNLTLPMSVDIRYTNQRGGSPLFRALSFYALDYFGQQIKVDNETYHLKVEPLSSNSSFENSYTVNSVSGAFLFLGKFSAYPGKSITLGVQTNLECLLFDSTNILVNISFKHCDVGETIPHGSEICSSCPPSSYSLTNVSNSSFICKSCSNMPGLMCKKGGKDLTVGPEYWRSDAYSLNVIRCPNPIACTPQTPDTTNCSNKDPKKLQPRVIRETCQTNSDLSDFQAVYANCALETQKKLVEYCVKIQDGTTTGICNQGYKGVLCTECEEGWGKSQTYECVKCEPTFSFFAQMILAALFKIGLICYAIYKSQKDNLHSIALRVLITFFQIESMLFEVPMIWPSFIVEIKNIITSLFSSGVSPGSYSFDCVYYWIGLSPSLSYFESNSLMSFFAPLLWTVAAGFFLLLRKYVSKKHITWREAQDILITTFIVTYFYYWPAIITAAFKTLHCIDIGTGEVQDYRLLTYPNISCSSDRYKMIRLFGISALILAGLVLPALLFLKLRKNKNSLDDESIMKKFGFLYRGYYEKYYSWEFLILIRKMGLSATSVFLARHLTHMCITISIIIGVSTIIQQRFAPFKDKRLNKMELNALFSLGAIAYGCLYHLNLADEVSTVCFAALAIAATLFFLLPWIKVYVGIVWIKVEPAYRSVKVHSKKCWGYLKRVCAACSRRVFRSRSENWQTDADSADEIVPEIDQEIKRNLSDGEDLTESENGSLRTHLLFKESVIHSKLL